MKNNKVLIVLANQSIHPTLQYPVGFWASELFHPIEVYNNNQVQWEIASPEGGKVIMDPMSDPNHESEYSAWDTLSKKYVDDKEFMAQLDNTAAIGSLNLDNYDAIMVAGGQSPMFTFEKAKDLQDAFVSFYESGKIAAALCHGVAILNYVKGSDGAFLAKGKRVTGFTNEEEDQSNAAVNATIMPWRIEDELTQKGANFEKKEAWNSYAIVDGNLITGQQNLSGEATALKIVEELKKR